MISKERLEELIKEGATIYDIFLGNIYFVDLTMAKYYDVPKYIEYKNNYYDCNLTRDIQDLFETKEEVEWELEFGNITRTETLNLPTWEELQKDLEKCPDGEYVIVDNYRITFTYYKPSRFELISNCDYYTCDNYNFGSTKENYIEACRVAKKMFLGE